MIFDPQVPFKYIKVDGWDDQWHSLNPAAPEMAIPREWMQVPRPSNFSLVPEVVAPEDRWPASAQLSPTNVDATVHKYLPRGGQSLGGSARFGAAWFMRDYRPLVAPEETVPQDFFDYFHGFVKNGKIVNPSQEAGADKKKKASLTALRSSRQDASVAVEEAATRASAAAAGAAAALGRRAGRNAQPARREAPPKVGLTSVEAAVADGDAASSSAAEALADLDRMAAEERAAEAAKHKPRRWLLK